MRTYLLSSLLLILGTFALSTQANEGSSADRDLATSVISAEGNVAQEVIKLYRAQLKNPKSKISQHLEESRAELVEAEASDLVLLESGHSAGVFSASYLLPIRTAWKSSTSTLTYIAVTYISDMNEEEINLSTKIYLTKFVDVEIKDIKK
jgi:hypothetical protein